MDRGRRSSRNVPRQRSLLQRDWPGLRLHVPAQLPHKSSISSQISFLLFKEGLEPRSKLEQQRKQVFKTTEVYKTAESHGGPTGMVVANMAVDGPFFQPANVEGTGSHHSWL